MPRTTPNYSECSDRFVGWDDFMRIKELRPKTKEELQKLLFEQREKLRNLRFGLELKKSKNVREIRKTKKGIARILTLLKIKKS